MYQLHCRLKDGFVNLTSVHFVTSRTRIEHQPLSFTHAQT